MEFAFGVSGAQGQQMRPLNAGITNCSEYPVWHPPYASLTTPTAGTLQVH